MRKKTWPIIRIGSTLGDQRAPARWTVDEDLGRGAFGEVFKVRDMSTGAVYAFKLPRRHLQLDDDYLQQFKREAINWTRLLNHTNIVKAYHYFEFPDQRTRPCISMEYVEGASLSYLIEREEKYLAPCQVVAYGIGICRGLKSACDVERTGRILMHRDISPDNILVSKHDNTPKVTDFGLAKYEDDESEGAIKGKWRYMAPDVIASSGWGSGERGQRVDRRADIYSLGVTMYHALSGKFPLITHGSPQTVYNMILREPRILLRKQLPQGAVGVTDELVDIVMSCISISRSDRPQTWDAFLDRLYSIEHEVREASDFLVCSVCGFMSRRELHAEECPLCSGSLVERQKTPTEKLAKAKLVTDVDSVKLLPTYVPTLLSVPEGSCVLGANVTFLTDTQRRGAMRGIDLGSLSKPKAHRVEMGLYEISKTLISVGEFSHFEREAGYNTDGRVDVSAHGDREEFPITSVDFSDAEAFCEWSEGRLPTPDEWEKAARGVDGRAYPWGNEFDASRCACAESASEGPVHVGGLHNSRSPYGLLHCVGNVGEWVDGGEGNSKLIRGGCFEDPCEYFGLLWARICFAKPDLRDPSIGFRMAKGSVREEPQGEFKSQFVLFKDKAVIGCDESLIPELECRMPLSGDVLKSFKNNKLRVVTLQPFEIGVFPVTNQEYSKFVQSTEYKAPKHWREKPFQWNGRPYLNKYRFHPVVNITQSDAKAYCRWLTDNDKYAYRLPKREEWEAASRGPEPRVYPWGDVFETDNCNGAESLKARTVDVRRYENGASPCGCRQMCGNVFEWLGDEQDDSRFMRGGSFESSCEAFGMTFFEMKTYNTYESEQTGFRIVREV
jgi:formylglycine-generating enzyme required for sulfatase activity